MITFPNAKINIGLNIVGRRPDGYHNIETVFVPIRLCDVLEVIEGSSASHDITLHCSGLKIDSPPEQNLIVKAYRLLKTNFEIPPIEVYFEKIIPFGAGLGGGSADAAFMLKMLNEMFGLQLSAMKLQDYAARLGADCAFFIENKITFAHGIGNEFENISISLDGYCIVLIKPDVHISTADAYAGVTPQHPMRPLKESLQNHPITDWKHLVANDFERSVFPKHPIVGEIKAYLYEQGAVYASMSGSGSSVFGIFSQPLDIAKVQHDYPDCFVWQGTGI